MLASGHQVVGFTFGMGAVMWIPYTEVSTAQPFPTLLFFSFVLVGSLLPDIDTPKSKIGQKFWRGLVIVLALALLGYLFAPTYIDHYRDELKVFVMMLLPVLVMVRGHRKMTHSLLFLVLLVFYSYLIEMWSGITWFYLSGLLIGVASHLFADSLTKRGIPLAYPFSKKYTRFFVTFRTGSNVERILVYSLVVWNIWVLINQLL
ncbi:metal-dependent hydrolase [Halobacillus litoralis]|uniref:metal-dependent hydrolase n=1 Tax=Halobacillus litoralis TaxID=45668 RepID=UPI001CD4EF8E|nr:metal-dependent hydrolase [Halobacillus litoralis]MCA0972600.1 metal-dependent hydrolase [Halobacillus litoralis]